MICQYPIYSETYHVSQRHEKASDRNKGTQEKPFLTIQRAVNVALPGDVIIVHAGNYERTTINNNGEERKKIVIAGMKAPTGQNHEDDTISKGLTKG